jgi:hypothetical protein
MLGAMPGIVDRLKIEVSIHPRSPKPHLPNKSRDVFIQQVKDLFAR